MWSSLPKQADPDLQGSNSTASNLHFCGAMRRKPAPGRQLICARPAQRARPPTNARKHLQLLPGTDAALALALMHELIRARLAGPCTTSLNHRAATHSGPEHCNGRPTRGQCLVRPERWNRFSPWHVITARPDQRAIRLNYGMRDGRGGGSMIPCAPWPVCRLLSARAGATTWRNDCCCPPRGLAVHTRRSANASCWVSVAHAR